MQRIMSRVATDPFLFQSTNCGSCRLSTLCFPEHLDAGDTSSFDRIVMHRRPMARGTHLFRNGDPFDSIYVVRSGAVKSTMVTADGEEHVLNLYLSGEVVGLNAIDHASYPTSAVALDTTAVCEIPYQRLEQLGREIPGLNQALVKLISRELLIEQEMALAMAKRTAEERVVIALVRLAVRTGGEAGLARRFRLPTSRRDLSNYLGLAPETVSRLFKRLEAQDVIAIDERDIILLDVPRLYDLAHLDMPDDADTVECRRA